MKRSEPESKKPASRAVQEVVNRGGGQPLDDAVRATMEKALGFDFSTVRVHTDDEAARSARAVGARAYTVGDDIVFGSGRYQPESCSGQQILAHELAHVVQQRAGAVSGVEMGDGLAVSEPSDAFERAADASAARVASGTVAANRPDVVGHTSQSNRVVQRAPDEITVNPGVVTGASKKMNDITFYEWNWSVVVDGQGYLYNDWIDTNDPALEPELRESLIARLKAGHRENLQGIL